MDLYGLIVAAHHPGMRRVSDLNPNGRAAGGNRTNRWGSSSALTGHGLLFSAKCHRPRIHLQVGMRRMIDFVKRYRSDFLMCAFVAQMRPSRRGSSTFGGNLPGVPSVAGLALQEWRPARPVGRCRDARSSPSTGVPHFPQTWLTSSKKVKSFAWTVLNNLLRDSAQFGDLRYREPAFTSGAGVKIAFAVDTTVVAYGVIEPRH